MAISETALFLTNPDLAQAARRQRLAEMFLRGNQQEDIKHPLQGVSSVVNKLLGAYLMRGSLDAGDEAQAKAEKERADFRDQVNRAFGGGTAMPAGQPMATAPQQPQAQAPIVQAAAAGGISPDLMPHIEEASQRTKIPVPVLVAQIRQESGGNPQAVGDGGQSIGPMQVQQRTAAQPGYGVAPIDPAALRDPRVNINFGADYLAARGRAAGVQDWNDPAQRAKGLQAYNGGGDPNYVANVERYIPRPEGAATGAPVVAQASASGVPGTDIEADMARAQHYQRLGFLGSQSNDPTVRHQADMMFRLGQQAEQRAMASRARMDALANRNMQTVTLAGPNGVAQVHELTPQGPGRVIGTAPQQQQMQTVQMQDPDGGVGIYEVTPQGVGRRIGSPPGQPGREFDQSNTLRDEFGRLTSDFRVVQTAYENIRSAASSQSGAGDMSMLYSYVKLLDPTSVVRESEFATAAASGSFGERVQGAAQRILSGERLPDTLRESFLKESKSIYTNQRKAHDSIADQYEALAKRFNLDPAKVVTRFARPQEDAPPMPGPAAAPGEFVEERPGALPGTAAPRVQQFRGPAPPPGFKVIQ